MPRENKVSLIGRITKPTISVIEELGTYKLSFTINVMRNNGRIDYPRVIVYGLTEEKAREAWSQMKNGSFAIVQGMITTRLKEKEIVCPKCGTKKKLKQLITEVVSKDIPVILDNEADFDKFKNVSDDVFIMGMVVSTVQHPDPSLTMYQIMTERPLKVAEQGSAQTDYPWIKSFGEIAEADARRLTKGSYVYIYGALQSRETSHSFLCENSECDGVIDYKNTVSEIISRRVEYLTNCDFSVESEEKKKKIAQKQGNSGDAP